MTATGDFNRQLEQLLATVPAAHEQPPAQTRRDRREGRGIFPAPVFLEHAEWVDAPGVRLRVLRPAGEPRGVYLHIHGGGWTLGGADMQDVALKTLADATGLVAASVEYRLAPEHPFPAGPDDCEAAALWLVRSGADRLGAPPRFAIGGESAGAHLAVVALLRLRDRHGVDVASEFRAANLLYGAYDLSMTPSQRLWGDRYLVLSVPILRFYTEQCTPGLDAEARRAPDISPLYARLEGMPRALFAVGDLDPLLDDSLFMSARWRAAGGEAELAVYPEGVHAFDAYPTELARQAHERVFAFLREVVASAR